MIDFISTTNDTTIDIKTICNPERISKLRSYINNYNFTDTSAKGFEVKNQHVSSEILDEDGNIVYSLSNTCKIKADVHDVPLNKQCAKTIKNVVCVF